MLTALFAGASLLIAACQTGTGSRTEMETPADVLQAMKTTYEGDWYRNLTFVQSTVQFAPDGTADSTTWYEAMSLPGKLRIDIGATDSGNTWIFRNDSIYVFAGGVLSDGRPTFHPLLLLGFDAYFIDTASLINKLDSLGFDVSVLSDTTWQDRPTWIVGADSGDTRSQQFWIDKERLVFVRLLQNTGTGDAQQDVRFNNYRRVGGGWVAPEVEFYINGQLQLREIYHDVVERAGFAPGFFSPSGWKDAEHWAVSD
jgi:hypothetical protein